MALIIENGSIVPGAESYATPDDLRLYAVKRGREIPADDVDLEVMLVKAMDWLEAQEDRYLGTRVNSLQALAWPRAGVRRPNGWDHYPSDTIPAQLRQAQCALAIDAELLTLQPTRLPDEQGPVTADQIGSLSTTYAEPVNRVSKAVYAVAEGHLVTLVRGSSNGAVRMVRA